MTSQRRIPANKFERIVGLANEGIWTLDADGRTDYINERGAAILGYTPEEMVGRHPVEFLFPEDQREVKGIPGMNGREGRRYAEIQACRKDGSSVWLSGSTSPFLGDDGEYQGVLAVFTDITDRKMAEEALTFQAHLLVSVHGQELPHAAGGDKEGDKEGVGWRRDRGGGRPFRLQEGDTDGRELAWSTIGRCERGREAVADTHQKDQGVMDVAERATIILHSGDMDKFYSALIIGNGALSMGLEVTIYFTFWGLQRLKKGGLNKGKLSKMNMKPKSIFTWYGYCNDMLVKLSAYGFATKDVVIPARYGTEKSKITYPKYMYRISRLLFNELVWRLNYQQLSKSTRKADSIMILGGGVSATGLIVAVASLSMPLGAIGATGYPAGLMLIIALVGVVMTFMGHVLKRGGNFELKDK